MNSTLKNILQSLFQFRDRFSSQPQKRRVD
uniref:Uncharacterized protein n=1 Tax=Anguilla anguilla TaxID=7936 RepID=A0A0E9Q2J7_ANGAN